MAPDDTKAALSKHLMCISHFLERADEAFRVPLPSDSLPTVRAYARDVLAEMPPALLRVFAEDRAAHLRTTVDAEALWYIVWRLAQDVSDDVLRCVPDGDQLGRFVRMVETLARSHEYDNSFWEDGIRRFATELKQRILRIKGQPARPSGTYGYISECVSWCRAHDVSPRSIERIAHTEVGPRRVAIRWDNTFVRLAHRGQ